MWLALALTALLQAPGGLDCEFRVDVREAEIGQPIPCRLVVRHPADTRVNVDLESLKPDDAWIVLEEAQLRTLRDTSDAAGSTGGRLTTVSWTLAALEPGSHTLAAPPVMCEVDGVAQVCVESSHAVTVAGALAEGEDAPRPPARPALPDSEAESRYVSPLWFLLLPGGLLLGLIAWRLARRTPGSVTAPAVPVRDRLAALDLELPPRDYCRELRDLVREGFDERMGSAGRGLTDEEWLARFEAGDPARARLADLLATCEAVRFGGRSLTRFAIVDLQREALDLVPAPEVAA